MGHCLNCGKEWTAEGAVCPQCGAADAIIQGGAAERESRERRPSDGIRLCGDGVYRWVYELKLLKNPTLLFTLWKLLGGIMLGIYVIDTVTSLGSSGYWPAGFWKTTGVFALVICGMMTIVLVSYLIYAAVMGGSYCVLPEMNEAGITHTQAPKQFKRAQLLAMLSALTADEPGALGAAVIAEARAASHSQWKNVRSVRCHPRANVIRISGPFHKNQVYASKDDFAFVRDYILSHCPDARIRENYRNLQK